MELQHFAVAGDRLLDAAQGAVGVGHRLLGEDHVVPHEAALEGREVAHGHQQRQRQRRRLVVRRERPQPRRRGPPCAARSGPPRTCRWSRRRGAILPSAAKGGRVGSGTTATSADPPAVIERGGRLASLRLAVSHRGAKPLVWVTRVPLTGPVKRIVLRRTSTSRPEPRTS